MQTESVNIITVSREFGAGGSDFAGQLGQRLGWRVLDRELVTLVAKRLKLQEATVERLDEHPPSWLTRVASALLIAPPDAPVGIDTTQLLHLDTVQSTAERVIKEAAETPPLIVVGHSAQNILATRKFTLHLRFVAPVEQRVQRLTARFGWDAATAATAIRRIDEDRKAYAQRYYHRQWQDPLLYDLTINTSRLSIADAVTLVARMLR